MSKFTDRIKNVFTVDYDDYDEDYYDDYEDDDMDLEPEKPEKKERVTKSRSERFSARRAATRSDDDIIDDYDGVTAEHEEESAPHVKTRATARAVKNSSNKLTASPDGTDLS